MSNINIIAKKRANELPRNAGVYFFYIRKKVAYIGKAINIRDRVKNHFNQPSYRDNLFVNQITKIGFIETKSEIEALILESNLIKQYLPRFNVVWRDDKNHFYVAIEKDEKPIVYITHQKDSVKTKYIGPFVEGNPLKKTLKLLRRAFPYYTSKNHSKNKCTWCHLGLCPGPDPDFKEYKDNIRKLIQVLEGKRKTVLFAMKKEMNSLAKQNKFEEASKLRDKIRALEHILAHTHIIEGQSIASSSWRQTEEELKSILSMKDSIKKLECYDISNIQGKNAVGSMVVFEHGEPSKSQYKKFRIRMKQEPNDIAMLKEVFTRRLGHPDWPYPEIMLIDGGKAQLNVAIKAKNGNNATKKIKVISIAKGKQELFIEGKKNPIPLKDLTQGVYNLIKYLDDEAHRFAITYHKKLRRKQLLDI